MDAALIRSQESHDNSTDTAMTLRDSGRTNDIRSWNVDNAHIVLVLVGLIGSGKSTFAKALEENFPEFRRCNQDDLGDRKAVEQLARESLQRGLSVCIDRTNFDETQRSHWIRIAREFPGTRLWCVIFDTPLHICRERVQRRTNHPTIRSPKQGIEVLYRFKNMFRPPSADEGFDRIFSLKPENQSSADYSKDELQTLLLRVATSSPPKFPASQRGMREYFDSVTPHAANRSNNWRERQISGGGSGFDTGFRRHVGKDCSSSSRSRSSSSEDWRSSSASMQTNWRLPRERPSENTFQNNGRNDMAADQALQSNLQRAPDRTVPSKQSGDGTTKNPILID